LSFRFDLSNSHSSTVRLLNISRLVFITPLIGSPSTADQSPPYESREINRDSSSLQTEDRVVGNVLKEETEKRREGYKVFNVL
jgi:hypothetical protein